jgi:DNA polymerase elongation subunit (family B)
MDPHELLFGRDPTPGIVAVAAGRDGRATVWRRLGDHLVAEPARFLNWFLTTSTDVLAGLPTRRLAIADALAGPLDLGAALGLVELDGPGELRYLVLTDRLSEVEPLLVAAYNKRVGGSARSLQDLRETIFVRSPAEQYLMLTGRTYFKGLAYSDLRRLQFDLETTGLDEQRDQIFMVSVRDSAGFRACLDTSQYHEREIIAELVRIIQERDPDVIENHNLFEFDLRFLVRRAGILGVKLALGRDGSEPVRFNDNLKLAGSTEPFTRYSVAGRELIDTLHAVKRFGAIVRDMRSHGLKQAARYFGVAKDDREYVPGPEIWQTFLTDPERVRRYALDDVDEVDELSRLLMGPTFALASMVPRPYERIATAGTGQGLIEPLLVRAYLTAGAALPTGDRRAGGHAGAHTAVFVTGVVERVVKADVASLYPSLMLSHNIGPAADRLGAFLALLRGLTERRLKHKAAARAAPPGSRARIEHEALQQAMKQLINSFYGTLGASFALFADAQAAGEVTRRGRELLQHILRALERRGVTLIEADTDGVLFSVPPGWTEEDERRVVEAVGATLPEGIRIEYDGRYARMYSYAEKNYVLQGYDGSLKIVGVAFRSARSERYGEQFLAEAVARLLDGDLRGVRDLYLGLIARLRDRAVPVADLATTMLLSKTPEQYRASKRREEQYEVLLAAGRKSWRVGDRVRYYQSSFGRKKLLEEGADQPNDYDAEYYVRKLRETYCPRLARALPPDLYEELFAPAATLFERDWRAVRPIMTRAAPPEPAGVGPAGRPDAT